MIARGAPDREIQAAAPALRMRLNPHPAGQLALNIPAMSDEPLPGMQHKYPETVLVFPKQGTDLPLRTAHTASAGPQFVGEPDLKMATDDMTRVAVAYLHGRTARSPACCGHRRRPDDYGRERAAAVHRAAARPAASSTSSRSGSGPSRRWRTGRSGS